jgi:uncharacterized protein (DUF736 family)
MANIGSFKKSGQEFQGEIVTLSLQTKGVRIVPETDRTNDNAPSHRVYVGRAEIGAAWSKRSTEGRDYLSVKLDDPSFNAPIYANLFDDEDVVREECRSTSEISGIGLGIVFDFAGKRGVWPRFLAFWDFAFERFVIP